MRGPHFDDLIVFLLALVGFIIILLILSAAH